MMKSIVHIPNDVLSTPTKTVTQFDKKLHALIEEMKQILLSTKKPKGVGLAANQIGEPYRVFLTKPAPKSEIRVFINPDILTTTPIIVDDTQKEADKKLEGCLSIPNIWGHVTRAPSVTLRYQNETGQTKEEVIAGFLATIVQHETDHTNGILFTQRVIEQKGTFYHSTLDRDGKEVLEEITIP